MILDDLRRDGVAVGNQLEADKAGAIFQRLCVSQCGNNHTFSSGSRRAKLGDVLGSSDWPIMGIDPHAVVSSPNFLTWALNSYEIAEAYFGEEPLIYHISAFGSQPSPQFYRDTHDWHRDRDNPRMLVAFMYATDVPTEEDGAHFYETGSHKDVDGGENYNGYRPTRPIKVVIGPTGTTFFSDPHGVHMGRRPISRPRILCWARWCAASCTNGAQDPMPRSLFENEWPQDVKLQQALRLIVQ